MALSAWKTFDFFDVTQVKLPDQESSSWFENNEISSVCSSSENLFLGTNDGVVRMLSSSFKVVRSFRAYDAGGITQMKQIEGTALLVTIAEDLPNEPVLKVWALDKLVKKTGIPSCLSTLNIHNGGKRFPITAFAALDDLSQLAVGFANGSVTAIRGDLIHDRGAKQRTVFESEEPITGVAFLDVAKLTTLYVATVARILKIVISGKGQGQPARAIEDVGCAVGCMTVDRSSGDIVVVRDDAIYYYGLDGRGPCCAFEGPKDLVEVYQDYVAVVSPPVSPPKNGLRGLGGFQVSDMFSTSSFTLLDTDLKFVAHTQSLVSPVKYIVVIWGDLFTLTQDGKIFRYHEKTLQQRLDILFQRNLFLPAINLAQRSGMTSEQQTVIFRKYGDHLYQKGDLDAAMQQYIKAIDSTEPSQVIRKYLDTQQIHNLIEYLEELHERHKAGADHTTLLLNCYAKLKDVVKLEKFIKSEGDLKFDLDTAISMCRQGGYYEQAAYLATKHGEHELVIDILIEDLKNYSDALQYIWRLDTETAYPNLMKYSRVLLEHCPADTTKFFIDYYTGHYVPRTDVVIDKIPTPPGGYAAGAANAVQNLANLLPLPYMNTSSTATPPDVAAVQPTVSDQGFKPAAPSYTAPQPRTAFSSFVDHPDNFITFLEACLKEDDVDETARIDLNTTLFEMYLFKANEKKSDREEWEAKAKQLIEGRDVSMDTSNVLLLSHLADFKDGTILMREQSGLILDIFQSYTSAKDTRGAIKALRKYGSQEPQLYPAALSYFTSDPDILDEAGDELDAVLKKIDAEGLMAPLQVIQTLSTNGVATMGMIKPYLQQTIARERHDISTNRRLTASYRAETEAKRHELLELASKPVAFTSTRCGACPQQLEPPVVHFLCKHSFHQRCLNVVPSEPTASSAPAAPRTTVRANGTSAPATADTANAECPLCAQSNSTIRAIRRAQDETAARHDLFRDVLARSHDRFGTVAEFFGRGVMAVPAAE